MNIKQSIINTAKLTFEMESHAISNLSSLLDENFDDAVELIYNRSEERRVWKDCISRLSPYH